MDRWEEVRDAFHQALDLPAEQWPAWLSDIQDPQLRGELERLLATASGMNRAFLENGPAINGRYRIERPLGHGGQATVWVARDLQDGGRPVAIKVLHLEDEHAAWLRKRFVHEWTVLSTLRHESIVAVRDFGEMDGRPFLVMEYVEGETLRDRMRRPLEPASIAAITRQLGSALGAAHRLRICHRDLKPENVIVTGQDQVKLIDFGVAQIDRRESGGTVTVLMLAGTARYMAPEQFLGVCSPRSDVYSLAVVVYEMLSGHCPYLADEAMGIARAQRRLPVGAVLRETREVPKRLAPVLEKALSLDPEQRPDDIEVFASAAAGIILEPKPSWKTSARTALGWLRRSPVPRIVFACVLAAVLGRQAVLRWQDAHIAMVYETIGPRDPVDDGFQPHNDVSGTVRYNESGDSLEAWEISTNSQGHYHRPLTNAQKRVALSNGWKLTAVARPIEGHVYADVDFFEYSALFLMEFINVDGRLLARGCNRLEPQYDFTDAFTGADPNAYHEFFMTYDPQSKSAQIGVDGKVVITGYRGMRQYQDPNMGVDFGTERYKSARGRAAFKRVRFEILRRPGNF